MKKIMCVKSWKLSQEGKQFTLVSSDIAKRLIDGEIFNRSAIYMSINPEDSSEANSLQTNLLQIHQFASDMIHVIFSIIGESHMRTAEINQLIKTETKDGFNNVYVKHIPRKPRRKVVSK